MSAIKAIEFPGKTFANKAELFAFLKQHEGRIIELKKAQSYKSFEKKQFSFLNLSKNFDASKANFSAKENYIYPIISTTKYMDSHMDVHFDGCFNKTCKDQQGQVYYCLDHELKWDSILAWQKDVKMFISDISWSIVGKNYSGNTQALVFEISKDKILRKEVLEAIENKAADFENSIRMNYVKIYLGINSNSKDYVQNKQYWDSRINDISNKEVAEEAGYFWGVEELRIHKEGSLVVAGGSNDATSIYIKSQPLDNTETDQPEDSTDKKINYDYLSKNLTIKI